MQAYLFPGQGSQTVGMGKDLYERGGETARLFDVADEILGYNLREVMIDGPEEQLRDTRYAQPALFLHSFSLYRLVDLPDPAMAAGHSLGEYSALTAAGALDFEDAIGLVGIRASAMAEAGAAEPGTMGAIVGLDDETVAAICTRVSDMDLTVVPANYNSDGQVVVSGTPEGVREALKGAQESGARMAKELNVSGAFHSPLMKPAEEKLAEGLRSVEIRNARFPVFMNASATPVTDADSIRELLLTQLTAPVLWTQTMRKMIEDGASRFLEIGAGNVLQKLVGRISREVTASGVGSIEQVNQLNQQEHPAKA